MTYKMNDRWVEEFFSSAKERYRIFLRKEAGEKGPLTEDKAFRDWRFCNVFREDDKVTRWIRKNVREPMRNSAGIFTAMTACRFFNKIETLEKLLICGTPGHLQNWDSRAVKKILRDVKPIVGAAYVIKTPNGLNKLDGVCAIVDLIETAHEVLDSKKYTTLQQLHAELKEIPFFGNFMSYEITSDLRHTYVGENARDINTWAFPGPGACRGMSWLVHGEFGRVQYGSKINEERMLSTMQHLHMIANTVAWPEEWPRWEMREVEHWLCEYAKYAKIHHLGQRMKVRYSPS